MKRSTISIFLDVRLLICGNYKSPTVEWTWHIFAFLFFSIVMSMLNSKRSSIYKFLQLFTMEHSLSIDFDSLIILLLEDEGRDILRDGSEEEDGETEKWPPTNWKGKTSNIWNHAFQNFREIVISAGADSGEMLMYDQPEYDPFCAASRNLTLLFICIFVLPLVIFKRWSSCTQNDCIAIRCQSLKTYLDLYINGVFDRFPGVKFIIFWMKAMIVVIFGE